MVTLRTGSRPIRRLHQYYVTYAEPKSGAANIGLGTLNNFSPIAVAMEYATPPNHLGGEHQIPVRFTSGDLELTLNSFHTELPSNLHRYDCTLVVESDFVPYGAVGTTRDQNPTNSQIQKVWYYHNGLVTAANMNPGEPLAGLSTFLLTMRVRRYLMLFAEAGDTAAKVMVAFDHDTGEYGTRGDTAEVEFTTPPEANAFGPSTLATVFATTNLHRPLGRSLLGSTTATLPPAQTG